MPKRSWKRSKRRVSSRKRQSLIRLIKRLWKQDWIRGGIIGLLLVVLTINLSVRILGKSATFPLDPFHLLDKSKALVALAWHGVIGAPQPTEREIRLLLHQLAAQDSSIESHSIGPSMPSDKPQPRSDLIRMIPPSNARPYPRIRKRAAPVWVPILLRSPSPSTSPWTGMALSPDPSDVATFSLKGLDGASFQILAAMESIWTSGQTYEILFFVTCLLFLALC